MDMIQEQVPVAEGQRRAGPAEQGSGRQANPCQATSCIFNDDGTCALPPTSVEIGGGDGGPPVCLAYEAADEGAPEAGGPPPAMGPAGGPPVPPPMMGPGPMGPPPGPMRVPGRRVPPPPMM